MVTYTVNGAVATFPSPKEADVRSLKVSFSAVQEGNGDPSPSNIRAITGKTGLNVYKTGDSIRDSLTIENGYYDGTGASKASTAMRRTANYIPTASGKKNIICGTLDTDDARVRVQEYDSNQNWLRQVSMSDPLAAGTDMNYSWASSSDAAYFRISWPKCTSGGAMNLYTDIDLLSVDWQTEAGTAYGGSIDLITGELTVTHASITFVGADSETWVSDNGRYYISLPGVNLPNGYTRYPVLCNIGLYHDASGSPAYTVFAFNYSSTPSADPRLYYYPNIGSTGMTIKQWLAENHLQVVYELATPLVYNLTPAQIKTLVGRNNVWSNANGNTEVTFDLYESAEMRKLRQRIVAANSAMRVVPAGYQEYDYLQRTANNSRIDTGVDGSDTTLKFEFTYMPISNSNYGAIFGNITSEDTKCWRLIHTAQTHGSYNRGFYVTALTNRAGASSFIAVVDTEETFFDKKINMEISMGSMKTNVDGYTASITVPETTSSGTSTRTVAIGSSQPSAAGGASTLVGRFYGHFKIWSHGKLVRDYVPVVRLADSKAGFYDLVCRTFNPSIGSLDFTAGND